MSVRWIVILAVARSTRLAERMLRTSAIDVHRLHAWNGIVSTGSMVSVQKSGVVGVEHQRAQPILGLLDGRRRHDDRFLVPRDFRLRVETDIDGRHRADLHPALLVVLRAARLREVERLLLRRQVVDLERQIPVGVLHVAGGGQNRGLELDVRGLAILLRGFERLAQVVDLEIANERLRHAELHV